MKSAKCRDDDDLRTPPLQEAMPWIGGDKSNGDVMDVREELAMDSRSTWGGDGTAKRSSSMLTLVTVKSGGANAIPPVSFRGVLVEGTKDADRDLRVVWTELEERRVPAEVVIMLSFVSPSVSVPVSSPSSIPSLSLPLSAGSGCSFRYLDRRSPE